MAKRKPKALPWTPERIKALRDGRGLTQADAAAILRISQALWADWERGHRSPVPAMQLLLELLEADRLPPATPIS